MFIDSHLKQLKTFEKENLPWVGYNSYNWACYFLTPDTVDKELDKVFDRGALVEYCSNIKTSDENAVISVLSWGGMRRSHGESLFEKKEKWLNIITDLRSGSIKNRYDAYCRFSQLRAHNHTPGLGIAYFTKLICFLKPELNGYIMDQWTSKSINLLTGKNIIIINKNGWIQDTNDAEVYEKYCVYIENLAKELNCTSMEAEEKIFSIGRGKGKWRSYVVKNYSQQKH